MPAQSAQDEVLELLRDLNSEQRSLFMTEYNQVRKNPNTGVVLSALLGAVGAHHFWMGNTIEGVGFNIFGLLTCFFGYWLTMILGFWDAFFIGAKVRKSNYANAKKIYERIKSFEK